MNKHRKKGIAHINQDWRMTWIEDDAIAERPLKLWERILYWKWPDKSYKSK